MLILGYRVYQRSLLAVAADNVLIYDGINSSTKTTFEVKDLIANTGYIFVLLAVNQFNISSLETDNVIHIAKLEPSGPTGVDIQAITSESGGSLQVTHSTVLDTGGFAIELVRYYARVRFLSSCYNAMSSACDACSATLFDDASGMFHIAAPEGVCSPDACGTGGICCRDTSGHTCGILAEMTELCSSESTATCKVDGLTHSTIYATSMGAGNPIGNSSFSVEVFASTRYRLLV